MNNTTSSKKAWVTEEIMQLMDLRRKYKGQDTNRYEELHRLVKRKTDCKDRHTACSNFKKYFVLFIYKNTIYCFTTPSVGMGKIFTVGLTIALAWELPHEPLKLKAKNEGPEKTTPANEYLNYIDNSQFLENHEIYDYQPVHDYNINRMPVSQNNKYFMPDYNKYNDFYNYEVQSYRRNDEYPIHPNYYGVYRRTRRDLYKKISNFFTGLKENGRECVLKIICEVSQLPKRKGSFMEEIMKAVFRVKPHEKYENEDDHDKAYNESHNCTERYSSCRKSIIQTK